MAGVKSAAVEQPVASNGRIGHDARLVHVARFGLVVCGRAKRDGNSNCGNDENQTENKPWIHARPPFAQVAENPPRRCEIACPNRTGVEFPLVMLEAWRKECQRVREFSRAAGMSALGIRMRQSLFHLWGVR